MGRYKVDQTTGELTLLNPSINDIPIYQGVSGSTMSVAGLVPQAQAGDEKKALLGNGTWGDVIPDDMTGATSTTDGAHGLVPAPQAGDQDKFLRGDGTWAEAGNVTKQIEELQWMNTHNRYYAMVADDDGTVIADDDGTVILGDWKYQIV